MIATTRNPVTSFADTFKFLNLRTIVPSIAL
jgi:hypothetical protein